MLSNNFLEVGYNFSRFGSKPPRERRIISSLQTKNATNFQIDA
jgi:hypothetical protein